MERNKSVIERQNDMEALSLIRASHRCDHNERSIKYVMITLSFLVCVLAIFNRFLVNIIPGALNDEELLSQVKVVRDTISIYLNLASGTIIVVNILLGFYTGRMHTESTVLRDRYDSYIFNNKPNASILRPISNTFVDEYSRKVKAPNEKFKNYVFPPDRPVDDSTAQFEYIREEAHSDYKLYLYTKPFFVTVWVGFCLLILIFAIILGLTSGLDFIDMLINILIPSLSAITTICTSWHNNNLQMRQLTNLINIVDEIQHLPVEKRWQYVTNKYNMRILADGLFAYRASAFIIPGLLVSMYKRSLKRAKRKNPAQTVDNKYIDAPRKKRTVKSANAAGQTAAETPARVRRTPAENADAPAPTAVGAQNETPAPARVRRAPIESASAPAPATEATQPETPAPARARRAPAAERPDRAREGTPVPAPAPAAATAAAPTARRRPAAPPSEPEKPARRRKDQAQK